MKRSGSLSQSRVGRIGTLAASKMTGLLFTRKRLWIGPFLLAVLLLSVGWWTNRSVENAVKTNLAGQLQTLLDADVAALQMWLSGQRADAQALAADDRVRMPVTELAEIAANPQTASVMANLLSSTPLADVRQRMQTWLKSHQVQGFVVIDAESMILAGDLDIGVGDTSIAKAFQTVLAPVFSGETIFITPLKSVLALPDVDGTTRAGIPVMFVATPILADDRPIAALCLRIRPEDEFTQILRVARAGESGETYAFNEQGTLITNSRFDQDLKRIGLLPDDTSTRSLLNVEIRDPGVDMTAGLRSSQRRPEQPLTRMAAAAIAGENGVDVDGYRDYRGVPVVGAWTWLPEHKIGVATEVDVAEAFQPLFALRKAFLALTSLLLLISVGLCLLAFHASKLERQARQAAIEAKRLGQYSLDEEIGAGGMGVVYRAHHDMLHRPTAVKLLNVERTDEQAIARFEREVQLTSQLTHPNTIAIFDYGRTAEGVFYYAMEYLDGITIDEMVKQFGPLPESRVVFVLRQLCGSLAEAHGRDLIHRDIKPANIMLTKCGGMCDFVKLLDFGLVKPKESDREVTMAGALTGTPLYLSPEAIQHLELDRRSDLYAVGAVGYFMLTGTPVFQAESIIDICKQHLQSAPEPPSERLGKSIDQDLQNLILSCLAKNPDDRPSDADSIEEQLSHCKAAMNWTKADAKSWWARHLEPDSGLDVTTDYAMTETIVAPQANQ